MNDRELLEMAAKAAGIKARWFKVNQWRKVGGYRIGAGQKEVFGTHHLKPWNPLRDDGDALRLVVKLGLDIYHHTFPGEVEVCTSTLGGVQEDLSGDLNSATRRAITRAAAEIGKAM